MKIRLIEEKCPAQVEFCQPIMRCPTHAISFIKDDDALLGGRIIIDQAQCNECKICIALCCGQALESNI
jgi:NAD-dependent dihydropyrimidine dehydrogenase PreA subunit